MQYIDPHQAGKLRRTRTGLLTKVERLPKKQKLILGVLALIFFGALVFFSAKRLTISPGILFTFLNPSGGLKQDNGRINILLLGTGGEGHIGVNLSDTIILASISPKEKDIVLVSIPRDFWVPKLSAKVNSAYAFGEDKKKGEGLNLAKQTVSELLGIPIHYGLRVDFAGFEKAIDLVGGVDINVEDAFDDYNYPVEGKETDFCGYSVQDVEEEGVKKQVILDATGSAVIVNGPFACRFEHLHFDQGVTHMDGKTALKFVRSRMGTNGEGSDFARSRRQQFVIAALKEKVFSLETLFDPKRAISLAQTFGKSIDSDISENEAIAFLKVAEDLRDVQFRSLALSNRGDGALLENPPTSDYGGQWVLIPKGGNDTIIKETVKKFLMEVKKEN